MLIDGNGSSVSNICIVVAYLAAGGGLVLTTWGFLRPETETKLRKLATLWLLVVMSVALMASLLDGHSGLAIWQRVLGESVVSLFAIRACVVTYRACRNVPKR